ncbi:hypothetical protein E0V34_25300 [Escherichia coli]|nr:hypothetical protein [Escherichia coli]
MTKTVSTSKKTRKQHSPEFRSEALKLAERIGVAAAARELSLYESQLYAWRSSKRLARTVLIFTESSDQLSRATDRVPGLPASPGYVQ